MVLGDRGRGLGGSRDQGIWGRLSFATGPVAQDRNFHLGPQLDGLPASSPVFKTKAGRGRETGEQHHASPLLGKEKAFQSHSVNPWSKEQVTPGKCVQVAFSFKKELIIGQTHPQL